MDLKYLFAAQFNDGTLFFQTKDDVSHIDPKKSQFYDVLQKEDKLDAFVLQGEGHQYIVDLRDGHFEVDAVPFLVDDTPVENRRLIFFRRHLQQFNQGDMAELSHNVSYLIGWQANEIGTGKNIKHTIIIS